VACPAENTLLGYVGGMLDDESSKALEQHLDGCSTCRFLFADLARADGASASAAQPVGPGLGLALANPIELPTGTVVGRYVILGLLARGGMGVVYKAFDPELDRTIALKLVGLAGLGRGAEEARLRLGREARTLARLSHPNVVAVHDVGTFEGDVFLAMEFVPGQTLRAWLRERAPGPREVLAVYLAAGAGLAAAHEVGIVHRDFKPDNVMIGEDGRVRVLDFGLARAAMIAAAGPPGDDEPGLDADGSPLTRAGAVVGTPGYMAPEQDRGGEVDARSDQFSFCAALFEALYGRLPFEGETYRALAEHRLAGEIVAAPAVRGVTPRVRRAILQGLRVDSTARHADMGALLAELGRRPWVTGARIGAAVLALVAAVSGGWAVWARSHADPSIAETCAAAGADVERVWTPARRAALGRSFLATGHPRAAAIAAHASAALDGWAAEWSARRIELCEMPMRRVAVTERFVADRLQCLERRIGTVDALVTAYIEAASRELVEVSIAAVDGLERPASCDALVVGNATEAQKQEWKPAMRDLIQARLDLSAGKPDEVIRRAGEVAARARAQGETEPLCAALVMVGQGQAMRDAVDAARTALLDGIRACTEVKEESLAADAWLELVSLAMRSTRYDAELDQTIFGAQLAMLRLPAEDLRAAALAYRVGTVRFMRGDHQEALKQLRRAEAMWQQAGADKFRLELGAVANSLGLMYVNRGEWDAAQAAFQRSLAAWEAAGPTGALNHAITTGNIGSMRMLQRRHAEAEPLLRQQIAEMEALGATAPSMIADARIDLAILYALTSRCSEAEPLLASGVAGAAALGPQGAALMAVGRLGQGLCQLAGGDARAAVASLERARELADGDPIAVFQRPRIAFALARALWAAGRERPRAIELAERARAGYATIGGARADQADVDAWLASRRPGRTSR